MNQEIKLLSDTNDAQDTHPIKPYVEWDESIVLPSRKERKHGTHANTLSDVNELPFVETVKTDETVENGHSHKPLTKEQLRKKRVRYVRAKRLIRGIQRVCLRIFVFVVFLLLIFWWKCVYIYDLPVYIQQEFPGIHAYLAWKPWTFGPPILNLKSYGNPTDEKEMARYLIRMDPYKDVVLHPIILWRFKEH
ncbi:hypothetical protein LSG31_05590 [Fodinisporobacter ferrooxydans]|uniref:Uncharacterized protein n=1 Tax=Fodinisporobacter ferrooxydans TaxID=2901836 RepID=A0ABY4CMK1_9BACL|nr:hypothetical protein LSG31_05590 [Alicyclobacillaceae bacterium MYW30-H2]